MSRSGVSTVHLHGLNGIRALAALIVVFGHVNVFMPDYGLAYFAQPSGWNVFAVTLFFVLSGYLITYLLLEEKAQSGTVSLRRFYLRRVLRIWPLHYLVGLLVLLAGLFVTSKYLAVPDPLKTWPLFFGLMPNVAKALHLDVLALGALWSLGVEEQFYAFWPWLLKRSRGLKRGIAVFIAAILALKLAARFSGSEPLRYLVYGAEFDCMAIGALGALWVREGSPLLRWLYARPAQWAAWGLFAYSTVFRPLHVAAYLDHELYAVFFLVMIVNVSSNPKTLVDLEHPLLDGLGRISYGIYVYNIPVLVALSFVHWTDRWLAAAVAVGLNLLVAWLSFHYFETPFIRLKERFSVVPSQASMDRP